MRRKVPHKPILKHSWPRGCEESFREVSCAGFRNKTEMCDICTYYDGEKGLRRAYLFTIIYNFMKYVLPIFRSAIPVVYLRIELTNSYRYGSQNTTIFM